MSPADFSVDFLKFEFNLGIFWRIQYYLMSSIILCCLMWLFLTYFGYSCFCSYLISKFIFIFVQHDRLDWLSCIAWTKMKNLCHSKMVIYIENVLSLNGANFQYKFNDYPKGFWNSASYLNVLAKTKIYELAHI